MTPVIRLVTYIETSDAVADPRELSVSARHEAVLAGGERVLLLDDRGWSVSGPPDIGQRTSIDEVADTARMVVGPDEPSDGYSRDDMEAGHWAGLAGVLRHHGVEVDASVLRRLPHDVVLGERLLARLGHEPDGAALP